MAARQRHPIHAWQALRRAFVLLHQRNTGNPSPAQPSPDPPQNPAEPSQIKPNQTKSNQIKPNQTKSNQIKPNQTTFFYSHPPVAGPMMNNAPFFNVLDAQGDFSTNYSRIEPLNLDRARHSVRAVVDSLSHERRSIFPGKPRQERHVPNMPPRRGRNFVWVVVLHRCRAYGATAGRAVRARRVSMVLPLRRESIIKSNRITQGLQIGSGANVSNCLATQSE